MRASLLQKGLDIEERDFFQDRFTEQELKDLLGDIPPSELFSWKSPSFSKLGIPRGDLDEDTLLGLMIKEPRLIRRPTARHADEVIIGTAAITQAFT